MNCPKCNTQNDHDARFCIKCQQQLQPYAGADGPPVTVTIGRGSGNNLRIENSKVSKFHCKIVKSAGKITIEDLNSSNGTFVNGQKISTAIITSQDSIHLGREYQLPWSLIEQHLGGARQHSSPAPAPAPGSRTVKIGRAQDNDIKIDNIRVSRHHAIFRYTSKGWEIEDCGSANGTYVNGKRVKRALLSEVDFVTIGGVPIELPDIAEPERTKKISGDVCFSVKGLSYAKRIKTDGSKVKKKTKLVDDITVTINPGEFVGLIGPAGAGKTTLLMLMTGIIPPSEGDVFINDRSMLTNYESFKGQIGYVPQDDVIHRELKVKESFTYTAKLRLENAGDQEIDGQVNTLINSLGLSERKDTLIGSAEKKGISGGQRKRVNLGQELITEPSILFLDEPTSGLDPQTDKEVMTLLKGIANKGKIVILTTHNITVDNFKLLTHVIILTNGGKLAYFGPSQKAVEYFNVETPDQIFAELKKQKKPEYWQEKFKKSDEYKHYVIDRMNQKKPKLAPKRENQNKRSPGIKQLITLAMRYFTVKLRDRSSTLILLLQAPLIAWLISLIFNYEEGKQHALFFLVVSAMWLGCSNAAREIVCEQSIFNRERMVNLKIPSYVLSKILILSILCLAQCTILAGWVIPELGLSAQFPNVMLILFVTALASMLWGLLVSAFVKTGEAATGFIPILLIPQIILAGYMSPYILMTTNVKHLADVTISRWATEAILIEEYGKSDPTVIEKLGFVTNNTGQDFFWLGIIACVLLIATMLKLKWRDFKFLS